jgi:hypothetical protein
MNREVHVRICESRGLRCPRLLDSNGRSPCVAGDRFVANTLEPLPHNESVKPLVCRGSLPGDQLHRSFTWLPV